MALPVTFGPLAAATMSQLDQNFTAVGKLGILPCTIAGTNALTFTPIAGTSPPVTAYYQGMAMSGILVNNGTGTLTAQYGALPLLPVYHDTASGSTVAQGHEFVASNLVVLVYDAALASGAGGWHIQGVSLSPQLFSLSVGSVASVTMTSMTRLLSSTASLTFTSQADGASQDQTIAMLGVSVGDVVQIGLPASVPAGVLFDGRVSVANVVHVRSTNASGTSVTVGTIAIRAVVTRYTP